MTDDEILDVLKNNPEFTVKYQQTLKEYAGAGTLVPITGFANAVTAPAIDTKGEGFIMGVGTKIFSIAGPVILYGTAAGALYGVIYWISITFF